jgi:UDP-N-acetylmuramoyl-tripeptide--D-alanyl-D-alanine ligase
VIVMTLGEIAVVVGGTVAPAYEDTIVTAEAFVDSRHPVPGGLFVALAGERVDGHVYAETAIAGGAAGVLSSKPLALPGVLVDDVVVALGRLAGHVMRSLDTAVVIGVTGSQGKTSTKDLLASVLSSHAATVAARESQNNELGVPLTALRAGLETRFVVSEMGARGIGHIAYLAEIMRPRVGVVLNVGVAHLGEFGSREGIAAAKGELVEALPTQGVAVLNADDPRVDAMAARTSATVVRFGHSAEAELRLGDVALDAESRVTFTITWRGASRRIALGYVGEHQAMNAAAAAATALALGLGIDEVAAALDGATPLSKWRMELTTSPAGVIVVNDAYNANPDSVRAALSVLVDIGVRRSGAPTVAVLGEMCELGDTSRQEHEDIGRLVAALGISRLVTVGDAARAIADAAQRDGAWGGRADHVDDPHEALALLRGALQEGDVVLVKASRAAGLEELATALATGPAPSGRMEGGR